MFRSSLLYLITIVFSLVAVHAEAGESKKEQGPVVCYGPRGPQGHRGRVGPRGEPGPIGIPGVEGAESLPLSPTMDVIYLWSKRVNPFGPVVFQGYEMTSGYNVDTDYSEITIVTGGLYILYFYIRDNMCYTEIRVNGAPLPVLYDTFQVSGDQLWAQFALTFSPGDVLTFFTYEPIPYDQAQAALLQATDSIFYSATLQLMTPDIFLNGKKA